MKLRKKRVEDVNLVSTLVKPHEHLDAIARVDPLGVIERLRFIDVSVRAARWADVVRSHGLALGEHVVVLAERDRAWRAALLGVIDAGYVAVPLPGTTPVDEIHAVAKDCGAALILAPHPRPDLEDGPAVVSADDVDVPRVAAATGSDESARGVPPDEPALVLYARDGSGRRGAVHTHGSLLAQARAGEQWLGLGARDSVWSTAADGSAESIWLLVAAWHAGAEVIVVDQKAPPDVVLELLHRLRPTAVWLTDDEYMQLASSGVPAWLDLRSIRRALTGDAQARGVVAFHEAFGTAVAPIIGSPETGVVAGCAPASPDEPAAAIAFRGIGLTVVDGEGRELRAGDVGELAVAGTTPSLFAGYGRDHSDAPTSAEWFRLGRRGAIDPDGVVRLAPLEQDAVPEPEREAEPEVEPAPAGDDDGVAAHVAAAARVAEEHAPPPQAAETDERNRAEEERRGAKAAAQEAKRAKRAAQRDAKERADAEKRRRKEEEKQRKLAERQRLETAAADERRRVEQAERAKREAAAAKEALRAEEAERAAREAEEKRRADELVRLENERRREEEREAAARAEQERLAPGIRSMIDHYGFAGAPVDPDSRRESDAAGQSPALEDRAG